MYKGRRKQQLGTGGRGSSLSRRKAGAAQVCLVEIWSPSRISPPRTAPTLLSGTHLHGIGVESGVKCCSKRVSPAKTPPIIFGILFDILLEIEQG